MYDMHVAIRSWVDNLDYSMEFRAFIYERKLTAISQYDPYCFFENLLPVQEEVKSKIVRFFDEVIKEKMREFTSSYVMDFGILDNGQPIVIEINNFHKTTGSALFSWETDKEILLGRNEGVALRIVKSVNETRNIEQFLSPEWFNIILDCRPKPSNVNCIIS